MGWWTYVQASRKEQAQKRRLDLDLHILLHSIESDALGPWSAWEPWKISTPSRLTTSASEEYAIIEWVCHLSIACPESKSMSARIATLPLLVRFSIFRIEPCYVFFGATNSCVISVLADKGVLSHGTEDQISFEEQSMRRGQVSGLEENITYFGCEESSSSWQDFEILFLFDHGSPCGDAKAHCTLEIFGLKTPFLNCKNFSQFGCEGGVPNTCKITLT